MAYSIASADSVASCWEQNSLIWIQIYNSYYQTKVIIFATPIQIDFSNGTEGT